MVVVLIHHTPITFARLAYKRQALANHPDKCPSHEKEAAEKKFQAISEAYEVLRGEYSC
jgi:curved DNA-binding protein CbpA